jgi:secondary thiamine-phosphate synthase enzyme
MSMRMAESTFELMLRKMLTLHKILISSSATHIFFIQVEYNRSKQTPSTLKGHCMKSYRKELSFNIPSRRGFINITPEVDAALRESGIREGLTLVSAMHITASVFINDDESGLHQDYDQWLEKLAPHEPVDQYRHNDTGEDNADAHMKRQIMGREVVVAVTNGKLDFGPWEQIFYGEFDGRRRKRVLVKIIGE